MGGGEDLGEFKIKTKSQNQFGTSIIPDSAELIEFIRANFKKSFSRSGIVNLLHRMGFVYKQTSIIPSKYDEKKQELFKREYEKIKEELSEEDTINCLNTSKLPGHNFRQYNFLLVEKPRPKKWLADTSRRFKADNIRQYFSSLKTGIKSFTVIVTKNFCSSVSLFLPSGGIFL
ncbi:MAG: winged helix-turn-helix domain-containing protein [Ignavibacteria bacterium]